MFINDIPPLTSSEVIKIEEVHYYNEIFEEKEDDIMKPLDTVKVTSGYGERINPVTKKQEFHHGVDIVGGSKIYATAEGKVVKVINKGEKGGTMCLIRIQHKDYQSAYYHIKSGSARVKVGDWVKAGQWIATVGDTGRVTGKHLHFQIDKGSNKTSINPTEYAKGNKELAGLPNPLDEWTEGDYKTLAKKYLRKTPEVASNNKVKYKNLTENAKKKCTKDALGYAKYKIGVTINLKEFRLDKNDYVWGRTNTLWLCVEDKTGNQVKKIN